MGENAVLSAREPCARGDAYLPLDDVKTRDHFGDAVLDLQAGVHLHKVEVVVHVEQKLDRAGVDIMHSLCRLDRRDHHFFAGLFVKRGAGAFLDHLLILALNAAFALAEADDVVVFIAEKLHFDVLYGADELFKIARAVAEGGLCLGASREERLFKAVDGVYAADTFAAAARARLDKKRKADALRLNLCLFNVLDHVAAGGDRNARRAHGFARHVLVAEHGDHVGGGSDEVDIALLAERNELGVFAEQTVARVDSLSAAFDSDGEDSRDIEVTVCYAVAAHAVAFVGELDVHGVLVGF